MRARDDLQLLAPPDDRRFEGVLGSPGNPLRPPVVAAVGPVVSAVGAGVSAAAAAGSTALAGFTAATGVTGAGLTMGAVAVGGQIYRGVAAKRAAQAQQEQLRAQQRRQERLARRQAREQEKASAGVVVELPARRVPLTATVSDPVAERRIVYGRRRVGGVRVFAHVIADGQKLLEVIAVSEGPINNCHGVFVDGRRTSLTPETDPAQRNNATKFWRATWSGEKYADHLKVWFHDGSEGQAANSYLTSQVPKWTSEHTLEGVAYFVVERVYNIDLWPSPTIPITFDVEGRNDIYDPRDGSTGYTDNAALCYAHWLGLDWDSIGLPITDIDEDDLKAAADVCDELVEINVSDTEDGVTFSGDGETVSAGSDPLPVFYPGQRVTVESTGTLPSPMAADTVYRVNPWADPSRLQFFDNETGDPIDVGTDGSGTHTVKPYGYEPRYTVGAVVIVNEPESIRQAFEDAMFGGAVPTGGTWRIFAGAYVAPTIEITEEHLLGPVSINQKVGRRSRANVVKGAYASASNGYEATDYPAQTEADYVTADGARHVSDFSLPYVTSGHQSQRLGRLQLEHGRRERGLTVFCDLRVFEAIPGASVLVTLPRLGIDSAPFLVDSWRLLATPGGAVGVELTLSETSPDVYGFDPVAVTSNVAVTPIVDTSPPTVATPVADPAAGYHDAGDFPLSVTLTCSTDESVIRWSKTATPATINGGSAYTGAISVADGETLYCRAFRSGWMASAALVGEYSSASATGEIEWNAGGGIEWNAGGAQEWN